MMIIKNALKVFNRISKKPGILEDLKKFNNLDKICLYHWQPCIRWNSHKPKVKSFLLT